MAKILVVDDELVFRDTLAFNLNRDGYEVLTAADGPTAVETALTAQPDLVLLDLMLPGISGIEVCKRVREYSNVPIIMVTAKDDEIDKVVGLEVGADDYLTKPYSYRELVARIRAGLRRSSGDQAEDDAAGQGGVADADAGHGLDNGPLGTNLLMGQKNQLGHD